MLIEACLELMETDAIVAIRDMGARGRDPLRGRDGRQGRSLGIELDLDQVPVREAGMIPYEIMLSESQERDADDPRARQRGMARRVEKVGIDSR
jgi:phosphoribosylformylglycinamidine synthase